MCVYLLACHVCSLFVVSDTFQLLIEQMKNVKVGPVEDFSVFTSSVIDERSFDRIAGYIDDAKNSPDCEIIGMYTCVFICIGIVVLVCVCYCSVNIS
jgi:acyl-CoA reductase-like NAD-dependent aldehyde dehydrogenase